MIKFEKHITVRDPENTVIDVLSNSCSNVSNSALKQAMKNGAVWLSHGASTQRVRRAKKQVFEGDELHIYFNEAILFSDIPPAQLVADEHDYSLWNKPCGMYSQGSKWGDHTAICRWVALQGLTLNGLPQRPVFLVHRLDRATQGLIIVAHSKRVAAKFAALFATRKIRKHYIATVKGHFPEYLLGQCIKESVEGKSASTRILEISYDKKFDESCVRVQLETGRKHQIRQHLSGLGFPVLGDRLYGSEGNKPNLPDLKLLSCYLEFICPISLENKKYTLT